MACELIRTSSQDLYNTVLAGAFVQTAGTVSLWALPVSDGVDYGESVIDFTTIIGHGNTWSAILQLTDNTIRMYYYDGDLKTKDSTGALSKTAWNHIMYTWNSSGSQLYLDGVQDWTDGSFTWQDIHNDYSGKTTYLGSQAATVTSPNYFDGYIDDYRVYDAHMSAADAAAIYHGLGKDNITTNLVQRVVFIGQTAATISSGIDYSGGGNTMTPNSSPKFYAAPLRV